MHRLLLAEEMGRSGGQGEGVAAEAGVKIPLLIVQRTTMTTEEPDRNQCEWNQLPETAKQSQNQINVALVLQAMAS